MENKASRHKQEKQDSNAAESHPQGNAPARYRGQRAPMPVLGEKAEDYLREEANIEDLPDQQDEADYEKEIKKSRQGEKKAGHK